MKDILVPRQRFEYWDRIKQQDYALIKDQGIRAEKNIVAWIFRAADPESINDEQWLAVRLSISGMLLHEAVAVDPEIRSGVPVLRGTRISISQILIEMADGETVEGFAEEYDIDAAMIKKFLEGLAIHLDRSFAK